MVSLPILAPLPGISKAQTVDGREVDIAFVDGKIDTIQEHRAQDSSWIDVGGRVVVPAFADIHTHLDKAGSLPALSSGPRANEPRLGWAARVMNDLKAQRDVAQIRATARQWALRMLAQGTTAVRSHVDVDPRIGLRGVQALLAVQEELAELMDIQVSVMPTEKDWWRGGPALELVEEALSLPGVAVMGGVTCFETPPGNIAEKCFELALNYQLDIDIHTDETDDPTHLELLHLAQLAIQHDYREKVVAGHCSSLSLQTPQRAGECVNLVREAGITTVAMPITNLYLLGNDPHVPGNRGMTRVRDLLAAGARVASASDNLNDPFMPFGNADLLLSALLVALVGQLDFAEYAQALVDAVTTVPRRAMFHQPAGLAAGTSADLVVLDTTCPQHLLADLPGRFLVIRAGQQVLFP